MPTYEDTRDLAEPQEAAKALQMLGAIARRCVLDDDDPVTALFLTGDGNLRWEAVSVLERLMADGEDDHADPEPLTFDAALAYMLDPRRWSDFTATILE
jgi:hypothetical protein